MILGIDIGTSYSSAAVLRMGKPRPLNTGNGHDFSIPSAVFVKEDGDIIIGRAASASRMKDPASYRANFKRDFGTDKPYLLGGIEILPEQIYVEFFRYFAKIAREQTGEETIDCVYITHPVNYGKSKKGLLEKAAGYAGLTNIRLLDEPTAAALSYFSGGLLKNGEILLVYDFGGGTFDLSLVQMSDDGICPLTNALGLENCGGANFDAYIYEDMVHRFSETEDMSQALKNIRFRSMLSQEAVKIKHLLSEDTEASAAVPYGYGDMLEYNLSRDQFSHMIDKEISQSCSLIEKIAAAAGIKISDIDKTLCVGGSTRIPYISERLEQVTGKKPYKNSEPELAVCLGAVMLEEIQKIPSGMQRDKDTWENAATKESHTTVRGGNAQNTSQSETTSSSDIDFGKAVKNIFGDLFDKNTRDSARSEHSSTSESNNAKRRKRNQSLGKDTGTIIGIDLGFNESRVAVLKNGIPIIIPNALGKTMTPSSVGFTTDSRILTGEEAEGQRLKHPRRTFKASQAYIRPNQQINVESGSYVSQEITAVFLKQLKEDAQDYLGERISNAIISLPAHIDDIQRQAIADAASIAGLKVKRILADSTGAAISYCIKVPEEHKFMVCDLNGSNFDVSVIESGDGVVEALSVAGTTVQETQRIVSGQIGDLLESVAKTMEQAIKDAGLEYSDLNRVILSGGIADIPAVVSKIREVTGQKLLTSQKPEENAVAGAVYLGGVIQGDHKVPQFLMLDVIPMTLSVETQGGVATHLIERNTTIPTKKSQIFSTAADNQLSVDVNVLQGEREFAKDNQSLGHFVLDGIAPAKKGEPQIEVTFDIDAMGTLGVYAKNLATGKEQHITKLTPYHMSSQHISEAAERIERLLAD